MRDKTGGMQRSGAERGYASWVLVSHLSSLISHPSSSCQAAILAAGSRAGQSRVWPKSIKVAFGTGETRESVAIWQRRHPPVGSAFRTRRDDVRSAWTPRECNMSTGCRAALRRQGRGQRPSRPGGRRSVPAQRVPEGSLRDPREGPQTGRRNQVTGARVQGSGFRVQELKPLSRIPKSRRLWKSAPPRTSESSLASVWLDHGGLGGNRGHGAHPARRRLPSTVQAVFSRPS